jgi:hypothetical protein
MPDEYVLKEYEGGSVATTLSSLISAGAMSIVITSGSSFPTGATAPFVVVVDRGLATEEKILIDTRAGNTLTVQQRGYDGTVAQSHASGAPINHCVDAYTLKQVNALANAMTAQYDIAYRGASAAAFGRIAVGSNGHILQVSGGVPSFAALGLSNIADGLITSAKIADGTIATGDIADSAITSAKIANGTIITADLADGAVTAAKLETQLARGTVSSGYAQLTSDQTGFNNTAADITGLTVTWTAVAGRRYRITGHVGCAQQNTAGGFWNLQITDGAGTITALAPHSLAASEQAPVTAFEVVVPGGGSVTRKLRARTNAGTGDVLATSGRTAFILVEDIGV